MATGSSQCRSCHPAFYKKWATSHHGRAMQPFTDDFARASLQPHAAALRIGDASYRVVLDSGSPHVLETGPRGERRHAIAHVMGGKNTYYFLTNLERGRLQVLPLAFDVHTKAWYDMAASGVRMHTGLPADNPLPWTDPAFTFNTSCFSCHVSQLRSNYDLASDTYRTTWKEPGINCETCHDDGSAHIALYQKDLKAKHADMRILRTTQFTTKQRNEMCAPCHAKMSPISPGYQVTQRFFDHYDLVTLESPDYYPDGRDLGENYTYTSWLMSPCVKGGKFDCVHCHTSSGRYRFAPANLQPGQTPNHSCMPCHQEKVANPEAHSHHKPGTPGGNCIDCHMPKTRFANMNRSDHSMLPPTPAATLRFKSPNACNLCHKDKSAGWADAKVRQWHKRDYQQPVLNRASLVDDARKGKWERLPAMLAYLQDPGGDSITQGSLIRLLAACPDPARLPALLAALRHPEPIVRAAAATSLQGVYTRESVTGLLDATADEYRLVRIRAAASLARVPTEGLPAARREAATKAASELIAAYQARPDDFSNHTNLGNYYLDRGQVPQAIPAFETAIRLRPDSVGTLVNASIAYSRAGRNADTERALDQALRLAPNNAPAHFNRGLLLAELGRKTEAEESLSKAVAADPTLAPAAFNLCVLRMERKDPLAFNDCRQATRNDPANARYTFTLAFYLAQSGQLPQAVSTLESFAARYTPDFDSRMLLADLYLKSGRGRQATAVYQSAATTPGLSPEQKAILVRRLQSVNR
jgi:tetratricopeptide (TPR) repeat protein